MPEIDINFEQQYLDQPAPYKNLKNFESKTPHKATDSSIGAKFIEYLTKEKSDLNKYPGFERLLIPDKTAKGKEKHQTRFFGV